MAESVKVMLNASCTATTAVSAAEEYQWFLGSLNRDLDSADFDEEGWSTQVT
jgi:hypothetical protein